MRFAAGAYGVIFDEVGRALFCHRRDCDFWNLPGGGVESGEAPWQAVFRKVREEAGLEVEVVRLAGLYCWTAIDEVIYSFVCHVTGGARITHSDETDETDDARYFALDALPASTFLEHAARAHDAALGQPPTILRIPIGPIGGDQVRQRRSG
jgi:ADP-ribose pyrophosphatase YjhB (NUDIX family)